MAQIQLVTIVVLAFCGLAVSQFNNFGAQPQSSQFGQTTYQHQQQSQFAAPAQQPQYQQRSSSCPDVNGTYPVAGQCDAYIECKNGVAEEKLCPEGLLFNDKLGPKHFPCQYPIDVSCENRAKLQPVQATDECPHQFGYFKMGDRVNCGQFMNCVNGRGFMFDCPEGLAFSQETYRCEWPDMVTDCDAEAFVGFTCPPETRTDAANHFNFYRSPSDCQVYYICLEGRPRMYRCMEGKLFNELTNQCDGAENVTTCGSSYRAVAPKPIATQYQQPRPVAPAPAPVSFQQPQFRQNQPTQKPFLFSQFAAATSPQPQPQLQFRQEQPTQKPFLFSQFAAATSPQPPTNAFSSFQQPAVQQPRVEQTQPAKYPFLFSQFAAATSPAPPTNAFGSFQQPAAQQSRVEQNTFQSGAPIQEQRTFESVAAVAPANDNEQYVEEDVQVEQDADFIQPRFGQGGQAPIAHPPVQSQYSGFNQVAAVQPAARTTQPESPRPQTRSQTNSGQYNWKSPISSRGAKRYDQ